jgi:hypothetical protein
VCVGLASMQELVENILRVDTIRWWSSTSRSVWPSRAAEKSGGG